MELNNEIKKENLDDQVLKMKLEYLVKYYKQKEDDLAYQRALLKYDILRS